MSASSCSCSVFKASSGVPGSESSAICMCLKLRWVSLILSTRSLRTMFIILGSVHRIEFVYTFCTGPRELDLGRSAVDSSCIVSFFSKSNASVCDSMILTLTILSVYNSTKLYRKWSLKICSAYGRSSLFLITLSHMTIKVCRMVYFLLYLNALTLSMKFEIKSGWVLKDLAMG